VHVTVAIVTVLLSLSLIPGQGGVASHRPSPFQVTPEALWVCCKGVSWPRVPPGLIVGRTLEHQMFHCFFGALTVWSDGRVPAPDMVQVSCCQRRMASAYLCHRDELVPGPIPLPTLVTVLSGCKYSMDPGMWIAEVPSVLLSIRSNIGFAYPYIGLSDLYMLLCLIQNTKRL